MVKELRNQLSKALADKVADPRVDLTASPVMEVVLELLSTDGF